jgi:hypothetical protein
MLATEMSLPPICTVTSVSFDLSALNCGALVPRTTPWECVMFVVSAPWQLTSVNAAGRVAAATSAG